MDLNKLKQEAEEYLKQKLEEQKDKFVFELPEVYIENVTEAYLVGAKPREKRIKHLEDSLLDVTEKSVKKIADLEAQIEKMKRCSTCKYSTDLGYCKIRCNGGECNKMDKWEIKEND